MCKTGKYNWGENEKTFFDDVDVEFGDGRLFPDFLPGSTASANECTGLIQISPDTKNIQDIYDTVYSYRKKEPEKGN